MQTSSHLDNMLTSTDIWCMIQRINREKSFSLTLDFESFSPFSLKEILKNKSSSSILHWNLTFSAAFFPVNRPSPTNR